MKHEYAMTVLEPVCELCRAELKPVDSATYWLDDKDRRLADNALAVQSHMAEVHPVTPKVGDAVVYFYAWNQMILGTGPLIVRAIREHDLNQFARSIGYSDLPAAIGVRYDLVNPARESDYYLPSTGDAKRPVTFKVLSEYVAPIVETTLFDLLGGEWSSKHEDVNVGA